MTDPFVLTEYFTLLKETLLELGIHKPEQIWNMDETSVCLDPSKTKVVGGKGLPCTRTTQGSGKENVTVLTTVNAAVLMYIIKTGFAVIDGHSTHVDTKVVALASENNITILKLPAHTSHLLQRLDLAVFKSFKTSWDKKLLRKQIFSELFAETWRQVSPFVIQSGFRKGGIYPLNPDVIPEEKYDPAALRRWKDKVSQNKSKELKTL
ncbi:hypothetical protein ABMA28_003300 [Loxostege sticticalis]|uniref:DDE-1 domain-containing protein n=1 Tax=Loxostege sticticalis TaxID=481309 RepID=A0ABD0SY35_LOXSC